MARTVYCQEEGCGLEAAYILSSLDGDGTNTLCIAHWIGFVQATADALRQASEAIAEQTEPYPDPDTPTAEPEAQPSEEAPAADVEHVTEAEEAVHATS